MANEKLTGINWRHPSSSLKHDEEPTLEKFMSKMKRLHEPQRTSRIDSHRERKSGSESPEMHNKLEICAGKVPISSVHFKSGYWRIATVRIQPDTFHAE
jgi:hypothetical protein